MLVRPLEPADVEGAARCQLAAFRALDEAEGRSLPEPEALLGFARTRIAHLQRTDPDGSWVAELDGRVVGVGLALRREDVWFLSLLVVQPGLQSQGTGARLLEQCLRSAEGTRVQYLCSSPDPRALRRYGRAGFHLNPGFDVFGPVDRALLPAVQGVREGDWARDGERLEDLVRAVRGAGYGPDLDQMSAGRLFLADGGAAVVRPGRLVVLSARDEDSATRLLWTALAEAGEEIEVEPVLPVAPWAVQVLLEARLPLRPGGGMALRGLAPPPLHVPSGAYG